jgi:hypothetical protein
MRAFLIRVVVSGPRYVPNQDPNACRINQGGGVRTKVHIFLIRAVVSRPAEATCRVHPTLPDAMVADVQLKQDEMVADVQLQRIFMYFIMMHILG